MNVRRISADQNAIAYEIYKSGKSLGVTGVRTQSPRRIHYGYDSSAWSKPKLIVYGEVTDRPAVAKIAAGWAGEIEFHS